MKHGHEVLGKDALALLQGYESGGDCVAFLSGLPLFAPELESALNTIAERYQAQVADLCLDRVNSHAALEVVPWIGGTAVCTPWSFCLKPQRVLLPSH